MDFQPDAFSNGQIDSKLWLCDILEPTIRSMRPPTIWILGGWYGILGFLLLSREQVEIAAIRSFDLDEASTRMADTICANWVFKDWKFKAFQADANWLNYQGNSQYGPPPDIVINTSSEHFSSKKWFDRIPTGKLVVVQSNDMLHEEHMFQHQSIEEHKAEFLMRNLYYSGSKQFVYPNSSFTRFMSMGDK